MNGECLVIWRPTHDDVRAVCEVISERTSAAILAGAKREVAHCVRFAVCASLLGDMMRLYFGSLLLSVEYVRVETNRKPFAACPFTTRRIHEDM